MLDLDSSSNRSAGRPPRAFVGVACAAHVARGVAGGFAQLCHGRAAPLRTMARGDYLLYYSPTEQMKSGPPLRAFTALGQVDDDEPHRFDMGGGFVPFRRKVRFFDVQPVAIAELLPDLHFGRGSWGLLMRRGHFAIDEHDLRLIAGRMMVTADGETSRRRLARARAESAR